MPIPFFASLEQGEAVLRFPYDDRLRVLLRAIPGRRWDPGEKAWRIPLDPERAEALARLLAGLPASPHVSEALARAIARRRARRRDGECVLDLARPDENWWLSFPTDVDEELVRALAEHPDYRGLPAIGRALIPLDELSERIVKGLGEGGAGRLRLTEDAEHALTEIAYGDRAPRRMPRRRRIDAHPHAEGPPEEEPAIPPALEMSSEQHARAPELVALSGATDGDARGARAWAASSSRSSAPASATCSRSGARSSPTSRASGRRSRRSPRSRPTVPTRRSSCARRS